MWYLTEEFTENVMVNLQPAWFPDSDVIRLVPELSDFQFDPENMIVRAATPDMAFNPNYIPPTPPTVPPPAPPANKTDPWLDPKSKKTATSNLE